MRSSRADNAHVAPNLVRWGAVFAGTLISLGFFALLTSLWVAIATGSGDGWVTGNLAWFLGGTAIASLLLAGFLSGFLSGVRGVAAGLLSGLTTWGLLLLASAVTVPGLSAITSSLGGASSSVFDGTLSPQSAVWATFWSLLVGALVAGLGGIAGGAMKRDAKVADTQVRGQHEARDDGGDRNDRDDRRERVAYEPYPSERAASVAVDDAGRPVESERREYADSQRS